MIFFTAYQTKWWNIMRKVAIMRGVGVVFSSISQVRLNDKMRLVIIL